MNYQNQRLDFEIHLTNEKDIFPDGTKIKRIYSPRSTVQIKTVGGANSNEANITIWGLSRDDIAMITQFSIWNGGRTFNKIVVKANGVTCYQGTIINCVADFNKVPDISVLISCQPCAFLNTAVAKPFSFNGEVSAADVIKSIIKPFGMSLTNIDVDTMLDTPYLQGSPFQQILQVVEHARCYVHFSYDSIYMSKIGSARNDEEIYLAPETGLIGYPMYFGDGLSVKTYFNPSYVANQKIKLNTYLPLASGSYTIGAIIHNLSCQLVGAQFESNLILYRAIDEK
ncbi:hypothetical protein RCS94_06390 [Orbaceae bacterium ac157xtp]